MVGRRVLTWPPAIGSGPGSSETDRTSTPSAARASRVPSVANTSTPSASSSRANGTRPSRLATESKARTSRTSLLREVRLRRPKGPRRAALGLSAGRAPGPVGSGLPDWPEYNARSWHTPCTRNRRRYQRRSRRPCPGHRAEARPASLVSVYPGQSTAMTEYSEGPRERPVEPDQHPAHWLQRQQLPVPVEHHLAAVGCAAGLRGGLLQLPGSPASSVFGVPRSE